MIRSFKPNLLISRNRTILPFLNIIPASYPWLARRCSYFRSRMAIKVFHNSFMHCSKDLSNIWQTGMRIVRKGKTKATKLSDFIVQLIKWNSLGLCWLILGVVPVPISTSINLGFPAHGKNISEWFKSIKSLRLLESSCYLRFNCHFLSQLGKVNPLTKPLNRQDFSANLLN